MKWSRKLLPNKVNEKQITKIHFLLKTKLNADYLNYGNKGHFVLYDIKKDDKVLPAVTYFKGNSYKSVGYYFTGSKKRKDWINNKVLSIDSTESYKEKRKEIKKKNELENVQKYKPGSLIYTSGGYEQTNVSFYQIIKTKGKKSVIVKPIYSQIVRNDTSMSGYVTPVKDFFINEQEFSCRITQYGVSIDKYETATLTEEGKEHFYSSWY